MLDRVSLTNLHESCARIALKLVSDISQPANPGAGAGQPKLSAKSSSCADNCGDDQRSRSHLSGQHRRESREHPRYASDRNAAAIDGTTGYDLSLRWHFTAPAAYGRLQSDRGPPGGKRSDHRSRRQTAVVHALFGAATAAPPTAAPWSSMRSSMHGSFISALHAYSPSALRAAPAADPGMQVEICPHRPGYSTIARRCVLPFELSANGI